MTVRHCAATTAPRNCCPNCYAEQSHNDYVRNSAVGKQLKQKFNSRSIAQHHLPALDLFWASFFLRVQLTSLLLISPGLRNYIIYIYHTYKRVSSVPPAFHVSDRLDQSGYSLLTPSPIYWHSRSHRTLISPRFRATVMVNLSLSKLSEHVLFLSRAEGGRNDCDQA